jgi:hypothetical protein
MVSEWYQIWEGGLGVTELNMRANNHNLTCRGIEFVGAGWDGELMKPKSEEIPLVKGSQFSIIDIPEPIEIPETDEPVK